TVTSPQMVFKQGLGLRSWAVMADARLGLKGPRPDAREEQPDLETDWRPYPQERPSHMPAQRQGMNRTDLRELHNIAHFANLPSILTHGILSHNRARKRNPTSIANQEVQEIRHSKSVPG